MLLPRGQQTHPRRAREARAAAEDQAQRQSGRRPLRSRLQEQRVTFFHFYLFQQINGFNKFMISHDSVKYI